MKMEALLMYKNHMIDSYEYLAVGMLDVVKDGSKPSQVTNPYQALTCRLQIQIYFFGECRARSACTYVQSDLALHSPLFDQ